LVIGYFLIVLVSCGAFFALRGRSMVVRVLTASAIGAILIALFTAWLGSLTDS
jgi:hypothetical protein